MSPIIKDIKDKIDKIHNPIILKKIDDLLNSEIEKPKKKIEDFLGIWTEDEANEIENIIKKGCSNIDNEW